MDMRADKWRTRTQSGPTEPKLIGEETARKGYSLWIIYSASRLLIFFTSKPMASRCSAPVLPLLLSRSYNRQSPVIAFDLARSTVSAIADLQDRSPVRSVQQPAMAEQRAAVPFPFASAKKTCMCSPSNHPGAFRCNLHKNRPPPPSNNSQLHVRRSAMKNSLVRIGGVEGGEWMKKALSALIRPSSHQVRRRSSFCPKPSRLRHVTTAFS